MLKTGPGIYKYNIAVSSLTLSLLSTNYGHKKCFSQQGYIYK